MRSSLIIYTLWNAHALLLLLFFLQHGLLIAILSDNHEIIKVKRNYVFAMHLILAAHAPNSLAVLLTNFEYSTKWQTPPYKATLPSKMSVVVTSEWANSSETFSKREFQKPPANVKRLQNFFLKSKKKGGGITFTYCMEEHDIMLSRIWMMR